MSTLGNPGQSVTTTVRAEELPAPVLARFATRPEPGSLYVLTAKPANETDGEKLAALRKHVRLGVADADAGRIYSDDEVFGDLQAKYPEV